MNDRSGVKELLEGYDVMKFLDEHRWNHDVQQIMIDLLNLAIQGESISECDIEQLIIHRNVLRGEEK